MLPILLYKYITLKIAIKKKRRPILGIMVLITHIHSTKSRKNNVSIKEKPHFVEIQFWGLHHGGIRLQELNLTFQCRIDHRVSAIEPDLVTRKVGTNSNQ